MKRVFIASPMKLRLVQPGKRGGWLARTGEHLLLKRGRYKIDPFNGARWVADQFEEAWIDVRKTDPLNIEKTIVVDGSYRLVLLEPKWGKARFEGVVHVLLKSAAGQYGVVNWAPARGPIACFFPVGPGSFSVQGKFYEAEPGSFVVDKAEGPLRIDLPLKRNEFKTAGSTSGMGPARRK